jgi:hypothetical protein
LVFHHGDPEFSSRQGFVVYISGRLTVIIITIIITIKIAVILKCVFHRNVTHMCTKWYWHAFVSDCFVLPLPILFHHCSILIHQ